MPMMLMMMICRDECFKLALFYNICLLYDNVVTFYIYDILDMSRVPV